MNSVFYACDVCDFGAVCIPLCFPGLVGSFVLLLCQIALTGVTT